MAHKIKNMFIETNEILKNQKLTIRDWIELSDNDNNTLYTSIVYTMYYTKFIYNVIHVLR